MIYQNSTNLTVEQVYQDLRAKILALKLKPGQMVSENAVAILYGMSRTPIRAVFQRLANENLLEIRSQKGTYVSLLDFAYIRETVYIRTMVEIDILRQALLRSDDNLLSALSANLQQQAAIVAQGTAADPAEFYQLDSLFHRLSFQHVGRERLWDILQASAVHYHRFRMLDILSDSILDMLWNDHNRIFVCLRSQDQEALGQSLQAHLSDGIRRIEEQVLLNHPEYFSKSNG